VYVAGGPGPDDLSRPQCGCPRSLARDRGHPQLGLISSSRPGPPALIGQAIDAIVVPAQCPSVQLRRAGLRRAGNVASEVALIVIACALRGKPGDAVERVVGQGALHTVGIIHVGHVFRLTPNYRVSLQGFTPVSCPRFFLRRCNRGMGREYFEQDPAADKEPRQTRRPHEDSEIRPSL